MTDQEIKWVSKIPQGWRLTKLKYAIDSISKGQGITKEILDKDGDIACIRYADIYTKYDYFCLQPLTRTNKKKVSSPKKLSYGDVVFACTGELIEEIGKSVAYICDEECLAGGDIIIVRHSQNYYFMGFALGSQYVQNQKSYGKFKLKVVHIHTDEIKNLLILLPPLEEQKKIADFLDDKCAQIDEITKDLEEKISKLDEYKKEIVFEAVTKGLNPQVELKDSGVYWIGKVPSHWEVVKGKYCFDNDKEIVGARVDQYERLALTLNGVIKRSKDDNEGLQPKDFATYQILRKDELVFKLIDLQNISTSRVGLSPYVGLVSPAYIILKSRKNIYPSYAERFYLMMWYNQIFNHLGDDGVRSSLNASELLNLPFVLPPLEEQKKIADFLDDKCAQIDEITKATREEIETLKQYKQSLIYEYVTGKKEVPNE